MRVDDCYKLQAKLRCTSACSLAVVYFDFEGGLLPDDDDDGSNFFKGINSVCDFAYWIAKSCFHGLMEEEVGIIKIKDCVSQS